MIDAHCHLDDPGLDADRDALVADARAAGVQGWVIGGTRPAAWDRTVAVAEHIGGLAQLGVHPWFVEEVELDDALAELRNREPESIGEIGLDAVRGPHPEQRACQRAALRGQLALARELDVPVTFHCVRAAPELLTVVERDGLPQRGAMVHGWSGPPDQVERAVRAGLYVSFGPLVTRERARRVRESARRVPLDRVLIETDAPDQPLAGERRGAPADLRQVAETLAQLRGEPLQGVADATVANARRLWGAAALP